MTIKDWLKTNQAALKEAGINSPRLDCQIMLEEVLGRDRSWLAAHDDEELEEHQLKTISVMIEKRVQRQPLAYLTGVREFYGLDFYVDESVLIPRPETETLVQYAIDNTPKNARVLELGTGSGAIAVSLKVNRNDLDITATDISELALVVAERNATLNDVVLDLKHGDLFEPVEGKFDVILANLPYVPFEARRQPEITFEPDVALYGGKDGLDFYRSFFNEALKHLNDGGFMIIEFSPTQYAEMRKLAEQSQVEIHPLSEYIYLCTALV